VPRLEVIRAAVATDVCFLQVVNYWILRY